MAAWKRMRPRNRGTIVQVGSALSYRAIPLQSPYCGGKFAIRGFTDSLRTGLMHDGVDGNLAVVQMPALNPPQFDCARNKISRRGHPGARVLQPAVGGGPVGPAAPGAVRSGCGAEA